MPRGVVLSPKTFHRPQWDFVKYRFSFICVYDWEWDQGVAAELRLVSCDLHMRAQDVLVIGPGIWVSPLCPEPLQQNDRNVRLKNLRLQDRRLTSCDPVFLDDISAEGFSCIS